MKDKIIQWFVRLIRLDMEYFMMENEENHRCSEIYTAKITDSDKKQQNNMEEKGKNYELQ